MERVKEKGNKATCSNKCSVLAVPVGGSCAKAHTQVVLLNLQVSPAREGALFPISEKA